MVYNMCGVCFLHASISYCRRTVLHGPRFPRLGCYWGYVFICHFVPGSRNPVHYVPLDRTTAVKKYHPGNLPMRAHDEMFAQGQKVQLAATAAEMDRLSKQYGVKGMPVLSYLTSLSFPASFPYDFMYLIWENLIKNLVLLWTEEFKGINGGSGSYELGPRIWEAIGAATAAAGPSLPSAFGARPPNIVKERSMCTADSRSFWTLYLGPVLLYQQSSKRRYYDHFIEFVKLLHICLKFNIVAEDIHTLQNRFMTWANEQVNNAAPKQISHRVELLDEQVKFTI
ncbi:hypothetical protein BV22DRAFT_1107964 [Leucogyrophana mollusca]|uniref:Uncharacterized protein n=1 Tax=Leucogyrophana mollusca TaxID=85980 RepID=A0ACB8B3L9_9AGAM|nr:hypothetical protein BV22DRAFT_1107964 [Leucogyrophana mollusca]